MGVTLDRGHLDAAIERVMIAHRTAKRDGLFFAPEVDPAAIERAICGVLASSVGDTVEPEEPMRAATSYDPFKVPPKKASPY